MIITILWKPQHNEDSKGKKHTNVQQFRLKQIAKQNTLGGHCVQSKHHTTGTNKYITTMESS